MATSKEYIEYVCGQIKGESNVRYKKMFGDYMVYVDEKPLFLVCDNTVFVKIIRISVSSIVYHVQEGIADTCSNIASTFASFRHNVWNTCLHDQFL